MSNNNNNQTNPLEGMSYFSFVNSLLARDNDHSKELAHAVLGMHTELVELRAATTPENYIEEAGDFVFFATAAIVALCRAEPTLTDPGPGKPWDVTSTLVAIGDERDFLKVLVTLPQEALKDELIDVLNDLSDIAKRWVGYGKAPTQEQVVQARDWAAGLAYLVTSLVSPPPALSNELTGDELREIIQGTNVKKLMHRYQGLNFSPERALNRDLEGEHAILKDSLA